MKTVIYNGNVILPDFTIENGYVVFENGKITDVGSVFSFGTFEGEAINAEGKYISPGFIDLHVHGGAGFRFVDATKEAVTAIANVHAKHGTTEVLLSEAWQPATGLFVPAVNKPESLLGLR